MLSHKDCLEKLKALRKLQDDKEILAEQTKKLNKEIGSLQYELVEYFDMNEMQNIKIDGAGMFYIQRTALPQIDDPEAVKTWLGERGDLEHLMSFNANKFRAYWKEKIEQGEEVPPNVTQYIKTEIRMRKA